MSSYKANGLQASAWGTALCLRVSNFFSPDEAKSLTTNESFMNEINACAPMGLFLTTCIFHRALPYADACAPLGLGEVWN